MTTTRRDFLTRAVATAGAAMTPDLNRCISMSTSIKRYLQTLRCG